MLTNNLLEKLQLIFANQQILTDPSACEPFSHDTSSQHCLPDAVVFPTAHEQVEQLVKFCYQHAIPLTALEPSPAHLKFAEPTD